PPRDRDWFRLTLSVVFLVAFAWAAGSVEIKWGRLLDAPQDMYRLAKAMYRDPPWGTLDRLMGQMADSLAVAWIGTLIGAVFAVPLSFLAAENPVGRPVAWCVRQVFNIIRAVPEIIVALMFVPMFGLTPTAGVLAIGVHSIGSLGKLLYEVIEGID